ncbi:MAG TPA: hypothetical protein VLT82_06850 [Myxococcaceae bacterium]|nr:hypothetical protein [Myxococcaceae bacterium]
MDAGRGQGSEWHETSVPEEYATGRLSPERRPSFEAHLVGCTECLDRVESAERMRDGFLTLERRTPAAEARRAQRLAPPRWAARTRLAVGLAAAAAFAGLVWASSLRIRTVEQRLAEKTDALARTEAELARARSQLEHAPGRPPESRGSSLTSSGATAVPVLALLTTRGAQVPTLTLPPPGHPMALWIERELPARFERYRVTVRSEQGTTVLEDALMPATRDALLLVVDGALLPPGRYTLLLEGEALSGRRVPVSTHEFRTLPAAQR